MRANKAQAVLIVDDVNSQSMRYALTRRGFAVLHATSPDETLTLFEVHRRQIALVVIDLMKPSAGILDLASELERLRPGLPVLYVAGARKTVARCCIEAQSRGAVLAVPFTEDQFIGRVVRLLEIEAAARQMPDLQLWERLVADSDWIPSAAAMLYVYEFGQSALAAAHSTMLRVGKIRHAFRPTHYEAAPYSVIVRAADVTRARRLMAQVCVGEWLVCAA